MTGETVQTAAGSVREAVARWRELTVAERSTILARWALRDGPNANERALIAKCSGLTDAMVDWAIETTLGPVVDGIDSLVVEAVGDVARLDGPSGGVWAVTPDVVGHVWASTLPTSGWQPVLATLALGSGAIIKAPQAVVSAAEALAQSLGRFHPALDGLVAVVSWDRGDARDGELVEAVDGLVVSGGREAIGAFWEHVALRRRGPIPFVPFGPGFSVAVVPAVAQRRVEELCEQLALDVAAYDQLGCLSPRAIWVEESEGDEAEMLAEKLAEALSHLAERLPRGEMPMGVHAEQRQRRATTSVLGAVYDATDALVLYEPEPYSLDGPLFRTVAVHPFDGGPHGLAERLDGLMASLGVVEPMLHCAGVAGSVALRNEYARSLARFGVHRICPPGTMQTPPLTWHHDGLLWLSRLIRFIDIE